MDNKTEYAYTYANGDIYNLTIGDGKGQVSEEWIRILQDIDREEYNNNQTESRRHCSLNALDPDEYYLPAEHDGFDEMEMFHAWEILKDYLTDREQMIGEDYFIWGYTPKEIAYGTDLSERRIQQIIKEIQKKLKKIQNHFVFGLSRDL